MVSVITVIRSNYKITTTIKRDIDILKLVAVVDRLNERREHHFIKQFIKCHLVITKEEGTVNSLDTVVVITQLMVPDMLPVNMC